MSLIGEVGDIYETSGEMCVEWEIRDFFSLSEETNKRYGSPVFAFAQSSWCLEIYPNGYRCTDWVSVFLLRKDSGPPRSVQFTIGILGCNSVENKVESKKVNVTKLGWGWKKFYQRSELQKQKSKLVPSDTLTIALSVKIETKNSTEASLFTRLWNCSRDLKAVLDKENEDFSFQLSDCKLSAHKVILENRCDYFKTMFGNDWLESKTGEGNLSHIEGRVFKNVLSYLYSGDVKELDEDNVCKIYIAAHELQLDELKKLCIEFIQKTMSLDIVCEALHIAEKYEEEELKERSIEFLAQNAENVFECDQWEEFKETNSALAYKILEKVIVKKMNLVKT